MKKQIVQHLALLALTAVALIVALPMARAQMDLIPESTLMAAADTEVPSDVENVKAVAGDSEVTLTWNVATDNDFVAGYKIYYGTSPVIEAGDVYNLEPIDAGNKITYDVIGLENGTIYYFALTAYDSANNESGNYSVEASATPLSGAADAAAPKVVKAVVQDKFTVLITFSEAVNLPTEPQTAFTITEDGTGIPLEVLSASMDLNDAMNKTVVLTTASQKSGQTYIVTAGIQVTDLDGTPVESGTSDTAIFTGTDLEAPVESGDSGPDTTGPELTNVATPDANTVVVVFSEPVLLSPNPTQNFVITEESNSNVTLSVNAAALSADGMTVTLTTAQQQPINYFLIVLDVSDASGNIMDVANNAAAFTGFNAAGIDPTQPTEPETPDVSPPEAGADMVAPEDATNFMAKLIQGMLVQLSWSPSLNSAGDLASYILYKSTDGVDYGDGIILHSDDVTHDISGLVAGVKYYYKLAAVDAIGNESVGVETSFVLPETGPELALLFASSLGAGRFLTRRKRKGLKTQKK